MRNGPRRIGAEIDLLLAEGRSVGDISRLLSCARSTVQYHRGRNVHRRLKAFIREHDWKIIQAEYSLGATMGQLREKYCITSSAWYSAVKRGDLITEGAKRLREHGKKQIAKYAHVMSDSQLLSDRRYKQLSTEEAAAEKLRNEGFQVFSPTVPCDRIAVKDGKVFFVEFKKHGQKLRPVQELIQTLVPEMYKICFHD